MRLVAVIIVRFGLFARSAHDFIFHDFGWHSFSGYNENQSHAAEQTVVNMRMPQRLGHPTMQSGYWNCSHVWFEMRPCTTANAGSHPGSLTGQPSQQLGDTLVTQLL
ncbi:unnamed protein product [Ostreobium quekettii]|uniref:Uncharacterized protein n=1 Tax=Ostreobium quekettii TaxID=121088 RepID=A0A8S1J349_9CHLO|nr:unnamed protein product [Ostreobium quekettii]